MVPKVEECIFCSFLKTRNRENQKLYEDKDIYAILDDFPLAKGHTLVILKTHYGDLSSVSPRAAARLGQVVATLSKALQEELRAETIYVASLGEQVKHVHYHLIPRYKEDPKGFVHFISQRGQLTNGEEMAARIRNRMK